MDFLSLPLVLRDGYLTKIDLEESIRLSIGLILSTRRGSLPFYPEYGCDIWDKEYSDLYTISKADIRSNLRNAIDRFEKRLSNISVTFESETAGLAHALGMKVKVAGDFRDNNEPKKFEDTFVIR